MWEDTAHVGKHHCLVLFRTVYKQKELSGKHVYTYLLMTVVEMRPVVLGTCHLDFHDGL